MKVKQNIQYISVLQIIGPIFVIFGHSLNGITSSGAWYIFTKQFIYFFHMPLFFMISGYLLSHNGWNKGKTYLQFTSEKFKRLILPYLFWNLLFILPKIVFSSFLSDDVSTNPVEILRLLVYPRQNIWGHTWFLVGLFLVFLATPLFKRLFQYGRPIQYLLLFFGIVLYCLPIHTEFLCISDLHKDLLFFLLGSFLGTYTEDDFIFKMRKTKWMWGILAVVASGLFLYWFEALARYRFIPCFFILMALFSFACEVKELSAREEALAKDSFGIYIMHWPVMLLCRIVFYQILEWNAAVCVVIMILAGYCVPLLVIKLLRKIKCKKIRIPLRFILGV